MKHKISQIEIMRRRDMRPHLTFTIDPEDAKDFDDALSFSEQKDGTYMIGVHIADVTYYVQPGSDIDQDAYSRATSVYLVDKVHPMLPEELCNDLCSLKPNEDKLCMSVVFTMNKEAQVIKYKVCRTVICSDHRLNYDEVQKILDGEQTCEAKLMAALVTLNNLAKILRNQRMAAGSMDIEQEEMRFILDEDGHPTDIYFKHGSDSNHLIEEFMLLANRTIATHVAKSGKEFIYRVHDKPDTEKLEALERFQRKVGDTIPRSTIEMLTIRAMAKAVYSTQNIGHYGLQFDNYTHFTSPIRRYPDILAHRLVTKYILGERVKGKGLFTPDKKQTLDTDLKEACDHCSDMEQYAIQLERDSQKQFQIMWLQDHLNEDFDASIVNVTEYGLFVRLDQTHCEGLVPIRTICPRKYLKLDEKNFTLSTKSRTGHRPCDDEPDLSFTLGDKVRVKLVRADLERRQIDFELI